MRQRIQMKKLTSLSEAGIEAAFDHPRPERLIAGNPLRTTWNHYEHAGVAAGTWSCEPGAWRIAFDDDKDEFFHVISGRLRICDEDGIGQEFGPGEACVIPGGFRGRFEVLEKLTKHYVLIERRKFSGNNDAGGVSQ